MRESHFQGEWLKSWLAFHPSAHIQKIPDMPRGQQSSAETRFNPVKPYDFYCYDNGTFYAMELKLKTSFGGFPFKAVTENQVNCLLNAEKNRGISLLVINYRFNKASKKAIKGGLTLPFNQVFVMKGSTFAQLDAETPSGSIAWEDLKTHHAIMKLNYLPATKAWDLDPLFTAVGEL